MAEGVRAEDNGLDALPGLKIETKVGGWGIAGGLGWHHASMSRPCGTASTSSSAAAPEGPAAPGNEGLRNWPDQWEGSLARSVRELKEAQVGGVTLAK